jgi:hypothetical protein
MRKERAFLFFVAGAFLVCAAGCASSQVKRLDKDEVVDLSGKWNDTDARLVAREMINDALSDYWSTNFLETKSRIPVVVVGPVVNNSHEHINSDVFIKQLERNFMKSGKIKFVASKSERVPVRDERSSQNEGFTDPATLKAFGKETGADLILIGSINSVKDEFRGRYVILYQVDLELVDIETNQKVWIGEKIIKKSVKRSKYSL